MSILIGYLYRTIAYEKAQFLQQTKHKGKTRRSVDVYQSENP